jgi:iron(III) transport system ATP-binding protein
MGLRFQNIRHAFGGHVVFEDFNFEIAPGEIVCLLGPSGCGKTTLLRIAAGLERQHTGIVTLGGRVVSDGSRHLAPEARNVGLMFQDYALFPHLDVAANVAFGLAHVPQAQRAERVAQALAQVGMDNRAHAYPHTLSGGQQQRVALARALAPKPAIMLLDEPFSGLDQHTRLQVREETIGLLKAAGVATLLVTHHPEEGMFMADRMLVLGPTGRILQEGAPNDVYIAPAHPYVAAFFGEINRIDAIAQGGQVETALGPVPVPGWDDGSLVAVVFREHAVELSAAGAPIEILDVRPLGRDTFVKFRAQLGGEAVFRCRHPGVLPGVNGADIRARIRAEEAFVYRMDDLAEA